MPDFLDRRELVPDMNAVKVDVVGLQTAKARVHGLHHALAMIARRVRIVSRHGIAVLGGEDNALPMVLDELSDESLARTVRVHVRRADEVSAGLAVGIVDFAGFVLRGAPAPVLAERHGAQSRFGYRQTAVSQELYFIIVSFPKVVDLAFPGSRQRHHWLVSGRLRGWPQDPRGEELPENDWNHRSQIFSFSAASRRGDFAEI